MRSSICKSADALNNVFLTTTATSHVNEATLHAHEDSQKKRKLTNDSGYGDDMPERMVMDSILQNHTEEHSSFDDSISENNFSSARRSSVNESSLQEMSERFEQSLNCTTTAATSIDTSMDFCDGQEEGVRAETCKTKEKRRRMTPVPGGVSVFKPSQSKFDHACVKWQSIRVHKIIP